MKSYFNIPLLLFAFAICLVSCEKEPKINFLDIFEPSPTIIIGTSLEIDVNVEPKEAAKYLEWTSSDPFIATVSSGIVTGVNLGYATITVKSRDGKISDSFNIRVIDHNYLTFVTNSGENTLSWVSFIYNAADLNCGSTETFDVNLEYSYDKVKWQEFTRADHLIFSGQIPLYLRGDNVNSTETRLSTAEDRIVFLFGTGSPVECSGNILSLINYVEIPSSLISPYAFASLFEDCKALVKAPDLPLEYLTPYCYACMFKNCTNLNQAPELKSTELAKGCYLSMFKGCTSLVASPELPATEMKPFCYAQMFYNCKQLENAPVLPSTQLADGCYNEMFVSCINLKEGPDLPAKELKPYCYEKMFYDCHSLQNSARIMAEVIERYSCAGMYAGCKSIREFYDLPATYVDDHGMYCMYASTGIVTPPSLNVQVVGPYGMSGLFSGCVSLRSAPSLPALKMKSDCYSYMFSNCISLEEAPKLPSTDLAEQCYEAMFINCIKLTEAPDLLATQVATGCYDWMFSGCRNLSYAKIMLKSLRARSGSVTCISVLQNTAPSGTLVMNENQDDTVFTIIPTGWKGVYVSE